MVILGWFFIVLGFFGVRWSYRVCKGTWRSFSALEPIAAIVMIVLGIVGLFMVF